MEIAKQLEKILPPERIKSRLIDLAAYAPDAGFYYLMPKAVVQPVSEKEIRSLFRFAGLHKIPMTFRTAGTSLSGQSISDGILVDLSRYWNKVVIEDEGKQVRVQPGITGAMVNALLRPYGRKIGPDPASINSAMMGGILSNNASGMCCGVSRNSYHTTRYIRFILPNGKSYSTENREDHARFREECPEIYEELLRLREQILAQPALHSLIRKKYQSKNTVGYSVNAFIDHESPLDILGRLLIGAEGTLAFISEAVLDTLPDYPAKSTALLYFADIYDACKMIGALTAAGAEAVELMDRASLRSIVHIAGIPEPVRTLPEGAAALLVEFQGNSLEEALEKKDRFLGSAPAHSFLYPPEFTEDPLRQALLWKVRKGLFPSVGAVRESGTSVILEDIAFPVEKLGDAVLELQALFGKHGYENAIIFGHAKDGNIHFVVSQAFDSPDKVERYRRFLDEVVELVVHRYQGALKAEHGTGRNMAPFVETEWGPEIYAIMKRLKSCIDPEGILNPGVIINDDKNAHIRNLKELPRVEEEVDKCMECGFCEYKCPSRELTLTPRQRIIVRRELTKLKNEGERSKYRELLRQYQYAGLDTCAVDGLCATACPVDINTGSLVKRLRRENHSETANYLASLAARNFGSLERLMKGMLHGGELINTVFGKNAMRRISGGMKRLVPSFPLWSNQLAAAPPLPPAGRRAETTLRRGKSPVGQLALVAETGIFGEGAAVYFPTCISRIMGTRCDETFPDASPGRERQSGVTGDGGPEGIAECFQRLAARAGIPLLIPSKLQGSCCGQAFSSKGYHAAFAYTANQTIGKIWEWTLEGRLPLVMDISSCTHTLQHCRPVLDEENKKRFDRLKIIDSIDYIADYLLPRITLKRKKNRIVLHPVCSLQHMGLESKFLGAARQMARQVDVPRQSGCCGMAGDRGFLFPELTRSATAREAAEVRENVYEGYYSSARTCEMAMSEAVGRNYSSLIYLLEECSRED